MIRSHDSSPAQEELVTYVEIVNLIADRTGVSLRPAQVRAIVSQMRLRTYSKPVIVRKRVDAEAVSKLDLDVLLREIDRMESSEVEKPRAV